MSKLASLCAAAVICALALAPTPARAQVPQVLNYSGRVAVQGVNFDGTGQFRFALVNAAGNLAHWTNDGTHLDGTEPTAAVSLPVSKGAYTVLLGDPALAGMTAIPTTVFNNSPLFLRVWFDDGTHGSQVLTPDQRIASVAYAVMAGTVPDGAITAPKIAAGAVTSTSLAAGAVGSTQLGAGAVQSTHIAFGAVGSGHLADGAVTTVKIGVGAVTGDMWTATSAVNAPESRSFHSAVWTGSEIIVWGGSAGGGSTNTGARYNPATDTWIALPTAGAPSGRLGHTAVWTGTEMIVWGGSIAGPPLNEGGRYNLATNTWTPITATGAPFPRVDHTAVWTGTEMIVWGGNGGGQRNDGGRYNPTANSWSPIATTNAPQALRYKHSTVWTGSEMIVWGGVNPMVGGDPELRAGGRYNPSSDVWKPVAETGSPIARAYHSAVWIGSEMIVYGGSLEVGGNVGDTWAYTPDRTMILYQKP